MILWDNIAKLLCWAKCCPFPKIVQIGISRTYDYAIFIYVTLYRCDTERRDVSRFRGRNYETTNVGSF